MALVIIGFVEYNLVHVDAALASRYQRRQTPIESVKSSAPDNEFWGSELDYSSDGVKSDG